MPDKETKISQHEIEIARELRAAERESETVSKRYNYDEVMTDLRSKIAATQNSR